MKTSSKSAPNKALNCLKNVMTVAEIAAECGMTAQGVRKAIDEGRLSGIKRGREWYVYIKDAKKFIGKS